MYMYSLKFNCMKVPNIYFKILKFLYDFKFVYDYIMIKLKIYYLCYANEYLY